MKKALLASLAIIVLIPVISLAKTDAKSLKIKKPTNQKLTQNSKDIQINNLVSESTVSKLKLIPLKDLLWLREKLDLIIAEAKGKNKPTPSFTEEILESAADSNESRIILTGTVDGSTARLRWSLQNMGSPPVFKLFYSTKESPTEFTAAPESELRSIAERFSSEDWDLYPGTYYFRLCEWIGYKCGIYSNNVKIVIGDGKNVEVSPRARGKVRIIVKSSVTKLPVAGMPVVIEHSGGKKTNLEGWAEFNQSDGNVYVAGGNGFHSSEVVSTMNGDEKGIITIYIKPKTKE